MTKPPTKAGEFPGKLGKSNENMGRKHILGQTTKLSNLDLKSPKIEIIAIRKMFLKALLKML